ncbi:hypothetical protein BD289DRAFT_117671 [Coniella lustricola]|uniref:Uncharacterized protein n=1 Tax=Coniella lustricola TaxID=2025994 RepID=A0A2T2ZWS2_9PEZI|nr:hypothetical protein BD289DRAFT_117671 [Coniella lustricola]
MLHYQTRAWPDHHVHASAGPFQYTPPPMQAMPAVPHHHHTRHQSRTSISTTSTSTSTPSPAIPPATTASTVAPRRSSSTCCPPASRRTSSLPQHPHPYPQAHPHQQQDFQWLSELQVHIADAEHLKPLLRECRLELQQRQAEVNFLTREIQDRQKQVRDSNFFASGMQRRELQVHLQSLARDREVARREFQGHQAEFDRLSGQVQSHKDNIDRLMKRLRLMVLS